MIDFSLTAEQKDYINLAHDFAKSVMRPAETELDRLAKPEDIFKSDLFWDVLKELYRMGFHKAMFPKHVGGLGLDTVTLMLINEELSWGAPGLIQNFFVGSFVAFTALMSGKKSLLKEFTLPYCNDTEATYFGAFAGVEPHCGSDLVCYSNLDVRLHTTAIKDGNDYIINGSKAAFVSAGGIANMIGVAAAVEPERGIRGTGLFIIPGDLPGVSRGRPLDKPGLRCLNQTEVYFDDVRVPKRYLAIRPKEDNWIYFVRSFVIWGNMGVAQSALALMRSAYEDTYAYACERVQGGKVIIEHPNIAIKIFNAYQAIESTRNMNLKAAWKNGNQFPGDLPLTVAARTFACKQAMQVIPDLVQVMGAYGITKEYTLEKYYRDVILTQIEDGALDTVSLHAMQEIVWNSHLNSSTENKN